jgi:hypothetical protein
MHTTAWILRFLAVFTLALPAIASCDSGSGSNCTTKSANLDAWTVHDFDFHSYRRWHNPSHYSAMGFVNFTLENPVLDYKPVCSAQSDWLTLFFFGEIVYDCVGGPEGDKASFTFNRGTGELRINQTWNCPGDDAQFDAHGSVMLDLDCQNVYWKNPDWEPNGEPPYEYYATRTVTCDWVTVPAPVEEVSRVA